MSKMPTRLDLPQARPAAQFASAASVMPVSGMAHDMHAQHGEQERSGVRPHRTEGMHQRSGDRYTDISEFSPVGYLMLSRMGVIEKVNSNTATLLGVDYQDLLLKRFDSFVVPEYLDKWDRYFEGLIKQDSPKNFELVLKRAPAEVFHARLEFQGVDAYNKASVMRLTLTDITERRRAEQESLQLLQRNQLLMNTSLDGIHVMDIQGNLLEANDAFCNMLGYSREEMANMNAVDWDAQLSADELRTAFRNSIGESKVVETVHRRKDGTLIDVEISVTGSTIDGTDYIFASSRDITERKRIARSLEETTVLLRELVAKHESSLEEERKAIAREVHDELGQLLTSLRMDVSVMRMRFGKDNEELMKLVQNMAEVTDRAIHGVRNVAENLRPKALDIGIVSAIEWLCNDFRTRTGVSCSFLAPEEFVDLDNSRATMLFRIVQESLTNVTRHAEAHNVRIAMLLGDANICLEVKDDGKGFVMGMPSKRKSYGLLGMAERAKVLGGNVNVVSSRGKGTAVTVCIPIESRADGE